MLISGVVVVLAVQTALLAWSIHDVRTGLDSPTGYVGWMLDPDEPAIDVYMTLCFPYALATALLILSLVARSRQR